jgi:hypothetical protein
MQKVVGGGHVIQKVYAVAWQAITSGAGGPKARDPDAIPTKKEDSVATNLVHLAPCRLGEVHLVERVLGNLVDIVAIEEDDDEE